MSKLAGRIPVLGLCGAERVGKDSVANILVERYGFTRIAFADFMKECLLELDPILNVPGVGYLHLEDALDRFGEDDLKARSPEYRRLLIAFGSGVVRKAMGLDDYWVQQVHRRVVNADEYAEGLVITDVRLPLEVDLVLDTLGGDLVEITRRGYEPEGDGMTLEVRDSIYCTMPNPGTTMDDLARQVASLTNVLRWGETYWNEEEQEGAA